MVPTAIRRLKSIGHIAPLSTEAYRDIEGNGAGRRKNFSDRRFSGPTRCGSGCTLSLARDRGHPQLDKLRYETDQSPACRPPGLKIETWGTGRSLHSRDAAREVVGSVRAQTKQTKAYWPIQLA